MKIRPASLRFAFLAALAAPGLPAQTPAAPATAPREPVVELSPFVIDASKETGWVATQTLGGSRLKTDFKDLAQPLEVLTLDFMRDPGVNRFEQALITPPTSRAAARSSTATAPASTPSSRATTRAGAASPAPRSRATSSKP